MPLPMIASARSLRRQLCLLSVLAIATSSGCSKSAHRDFSSKDAGEIVGLIGKLGDATRDLKMLQALYVSSAKPTKEQQAALTKVGFARTSNDPKIEGDKATLDM